MENVKNMKPLFPVVRINGAVIDAADIAAEAQNHAAPAGKPGHAWQAAARALAVRVLLLQEAQRLGLEATPQQVGEDLSETDDEAMVRAVLDAELHPEEVTEQACQQLYEGMPNGYRAPDLFEAAHMLFLAKPDDSAARKAALQGAEAVLELLAKKPERFADLARENSDCPSKAEGGALGQISSGDTVTEFEAALVAMEEGELLSTPVETRFGFHVIRLDAKSIGARLPFEAVKAQIMQQLEQLAWAKAAKALTQHLVEGAEITGIDFSKPLPVAA